MLTLFGKVDPYTVLSMYLIPMAVVVAILSAIAGRVVWSRRRALADGKRVVGWIVQANQLLFRAGQESAPALLLVSFTHPDGQGLEPLASEMARLKQGHPSTPAERELAKIVRDERFRPLVRYRLPTSLTPGMEVYAVNVWVERKWLPQGRLTQSRLLCRAIPGDRGAVVMDPPRTAG